MTELLLIIAAHTEWRIATELLRFDSRSVAQGQSTPVGRWPGTVVLRSGWGKVAAAAATQKAIDDHRPALILCIGTCGGIEGKARLGELVVVSRAVMHDVRPLMGDIEAERSHYTSVVDPALLASVSNATTLREVTIGTGDRDLDEDEAAALAEMGIDVVDWESAAIAYVARRNGLPWLIVKGVSDMVSSQGDAVSLHDAYATGAAEVMARLIATVGDLFTQEILAGFRSVRARN
jgi:adenosylhomocysteine nucleosidase